jgi:transposase
MSRKKQKPTPKRIEVSVEEISAIVERTQTGALSAEEHAKLKAAIDTFALITAQLQTKGASIDRLRHMIFGATTESTRNRVSRPVELHHRPLVGRVEDWRAGVG